MAVKRTAQEAFNHGNIRLSAFAAAKLRRSNITPEASPEEDDQSDRETITVNTSGEPAVAIASETQVTVSQPEELQYTSTNIKQVNDSLVPKSSFLSLSTGDTVLIVGEYEVEVQNGAVSISGALLRRGSGSYRIFAPSTHALPRIVCRAAATRIQVSSVDSEIRKLEKLSPLFRNIWTQDDREQSHTVLFSSKSDRLQRSLHAIDDDIATQKLLSQLCAKVEQGHQLSVMAIGTKSTGKSTLNRSFCNAFLTRSPAKRCLYLDIDPGQPEFGPPGQVYLIEVLQPIFGPSYTHFATRQSKQYRLICAHTLAATTFKDNPQHYFSCVKHLLRKVYAAVKERGRCPLIINSAGWINGVGSKMLHDLLDTGGVTDAVLIDIADQILAQAICSKVETCHAIARAPVRPVSRTSAELRQMHTMAYFHSRSIPPSIDTEKIARWRPWMLTYGGSDPAVVAVVSYGQTFNTRFLNEVLEGTLVGVVAARPVASSTPISRKPTIDPAATGIDAKVVRTSAGLPHAFALEGLDPATHDFYALGLIRGIDEQANRLLLLTPLSDTEIADLLHRDLILVRGAFDNPDWAYLEASQESPAGQAGEDLPWVSRQEMVGIESAVWRLRHPPTLSQFNGRR